MKQIGNLAIVCAQRKDVTLRIEKGREWSYWTELMRRQRFLPIGMTMKLSCQ